MIFGKIDYINLLPFHVFLKKEKNNRLKESVKYKKGSPSYINREFKSKRVDAAFISSIKSKSKKIKCLDAGIVANKKVKSVIVKKGDIKKDPASATSNALANVLSLNGEVFIGDRALKLYIQNPNLYIDLAQEWHKQTKLPFVFARFCVNGHEAFFEKLAKRFLKQKINIPQYILKKYAHSRNIEKKEISEYLKLIKYRIGEKEKKSLRLFFKKASKH